MIPTAHLEIIVGAGVIAAAVVTTVVTVVGALTYLIFRERAHPAPAVPTVVPKAAARERPASEVPTAVAG
jgi:hypothetical protein